MQVLIIGGAVLFGWAVRRKAADVLKTWKQIRQDQAWKRYETIHRSESWRQVMEVH